VFAAIESSSGNKNNGQTIYTFTNKLAGGKFVPVLPAPNNTKPIKTYSRQQTNTLQYIDTITVPRTDTPKTLRLTVTETPADITQAAIHTNQTPTYNTDVSTPTNPTPTHNADASTPTNLTPTYYTDASTPTNKTAFAASLTPSTIASIVTPSSILSAPASTDTSWSNTPTLTPSPLTLTTTPMTNGLTLTPEGSFSHSTPLATDQSNIMLDLGNLENSIIIECPDVPESLFMDSTVLPQTSSPEAPVITQDTAMEPSPLGENTFEDMTEFPTKEDLAMGGVPQDFDIDAIDFNLESEDMGSDWDPDSMLDSLESFIQQGNEPNKKRRHTKGPKRMALEEIPADNRKNVLRCRQYRRDKNNTLATWADELEQLENRNRELKEQEKKMQEKVEKVQAAYIKLISEGKIKFLN